MHAVIYYMHFVRYPYSFKKKYSKTLFSKVGALSDPACELLFKIGGLEGMVLNDTVR